MYLMGALEEKNKSIQMEVKPESVTVDQTFRTTKTKHPELHTSVLQSDLLNSTPYLFCV